MISRTAILMALAALPSAALAAPQETQPAAATQAATAPAGESLEATVTGVEGLVQVRLGDDQPWQAARVGMVVGQGAEFRTGPRSAVRFTIPPDQTVALDRLGTIKVLEAVKNGLAVKTDLGMKYGRVRYDIEAAGVSHDSTIHSPGSTLAVRGTIVSLTNQPPFKPTATSITGRAKFTGLNGQSTEFGGKDQFAAIDSDSAGPAYTALGQTYVDPVSSFGRTDSEQQFAMNNPFIGAFTPSSGLAGTSVERSLPGVPVVTPPPTQQGSLIFFLAWAPTQQIASYSNLDLFVTSPLGEVLSPTSIRTVPSGGQAPTDDRGTRGYGEESAVWPASYPLGTYTYSAKNISGPSAEFGLAVFRDGQLVGTPNIGTSSSSDPLASFNINISATTTSALPITAAPLAAKRLPTRPTLPMAPQAIKPPVMGPLPVAGRNKR